MKSQLFKFLLLLSALLSVSASAQQQIVLLTSINRDTFPKIFYLNWYYDGYTQRLEDDFRKDFKDSPYTLVVKHAADLSDFYDVLHDPQNVAVFWVSHEAPQEWNQSPGIAIDAKIVDTHMADVKEVLTAVHPNLRWLSLIGCKSDLIIDWLKQNPGETDLSHLTIQGFPTLEDAQKGLNSATEQSWAVLNLPAVADGYSSTCAQNQGRAIRVSRVMSNDAKATANRTYPAVSISVNEKIIGVFPSVELAPGESKTVQTVMNAVMGAPTSASQLNIEIDSGADPAGVPADFELGTFQVTFDADAASAASDWSAFSDPKTGLPFGVTKNIYLYKGSLPLKAAPITFDPFQCQPMQTR